MNWKGPAYVCMYVCMSLCMDVCMVICMYICMRVCLYTCICIFLIDDAPEIGFEASTKYLISRKTRDLLQQYQPKNG